MSAKYTTTVGLEIHAELKTQTKMFCDCRNDPDEERPNHHVCPVCMGHPGTLPVINKQAVKHVIRMGISAGGEIADFTEFDRKNYFYPDIPKGYQISQYKYPLVKGGAIAGVALTRIHLEEDTARSTHDQGDFSLVDFNRAGLPLMELVTEPVIHDAATAVRFAKELQLLLQYLGAGEANMEKGEMRVEANISVSQTETFGTKVEVKNLNSFRAVERAIAYEVDRHIRLLEAGEKIKQETRGWDEQKQATYSQRVKEDSHDYRYFPDPDLPKLYISEISDLSRASLTETLPELPWQKRERYQKVFGLKEIDADIYVGTPSLATYFENITTIIGADVSDGFKLASNYISSDYLGLLKNKGQAISKETLEKISPAQFAELITLVAGKKLTSRAAKDILVIMYEEGGTPMAIAEKGGLVQKNDEGELKKIMVEIIANNPKIVADFRAGKVAALQALIGQGMKVTKGGANPEILKKIAVEALS